MRYKRGNIEAVVPSRQDPFSVLSTRTGNALRSAGIRTEYGLAQWSADDLLCLRNFGVACLQEVERFLGARGLDLACKEGVEALPTYAAVPSEGLRGRIAWFSGTEVAAAMIAHETSRRQDAEEQRLDIVASCLGAFERELLCGAVDDVGVMAWGALTKLSLDFHPAPGRMSALLRALQFAPPQLYPLETFQESLEFRTIDAEVEQLLDVLMPRERMTIELRFGLRDGRPRTLDIVGEELGVTRERARQIEAQALEKLRGTFAVRPFPRTRTGVALCRESRSLADMTTTLMEHGLVATAAGVNGFVWAWRAIYPPESAFPTGLEEEMRTGVTTLQRSIAADVTDVARKLIRQTGVVTAHEIRVAMDRQDYRDLDIAVVLSAEGMLEVQAGVWSGRTSKSVPLSVASKMVSVCGPLTLRHIRRGLLRHQRRQRFPVRSSDMLKICLANYPDVFLIQGDSVLLAGSLSPPLGRAEQTWLDLIAQSGPVIHADQVQQAFARAGLRSVTAHVLLSNSEIVQRIRRSLYSLPGAVLSDEDIYAARARAVKIDPAPVLTYGQGGKVQFATTLQQYLGYGGIVSAGPVARLAGKWQASADGVACGEFTVGAPWIYGLHTAREALELQAGDRILIEFDTWTRRATISVLSRRHEPQR